jgi:hypothetical protein
MYKGIKSLAITQIDRTEYEEIECVLETVNLAYYMPSIVTGLRHHQHLGPEDPPSPCPR